jgi:pimeloyl-ACP methyl ester carboxylesterase
VTEVESVATTGRSGGAGASSGAGAVTSLPPAVSGERRETTRRAGRLSYYVDGDGPPLLLIHSINAAGSAYEVRPIFERARERRRVYAVDLPGFGFSERSARAYEIPLYVDAVRDMLDVVADDVGEGAIDALALSLSSEFLARAAVAEPSRFRTLTFVTPTGFDAAATRRKSEPGSTREVPGLHRFFTCPRWSQGIYALLTSRPSIRFFLKKTFGSDEIDEGLFEYDHLTTRVPGARHAPYAFVSGRLFGADICRVYEQLTLPVWVPHGTRGDFKDFSGAGWAYSLPNWRFEPFATGALPHFEQPSPFMEGLERFLQQAGT